MMSVFMCMWFLHWFKPQQINVSSYNLNGPTKNKVACIIMIIMAASIYDEVIIDMWCFMYSSMFISVRIWKSPEFKEACLLLHDIVPIRPAAFWTLLASYFQHGKWHIKITIVKTARERGLGGGGGCWAVQVFTEVELLPSSGVRMYRAAVKFTLG